MAQLFVMGHSLKYENEGEKPWNNQDWMKKESSERSEILRQKESISRMKGEMRDRRLPKEEFRARRKTIAKKSALLSKMEDEMERKYIKI